MTFGERITKLRKIKGLTQRNIAQKVGIASSTYSSYEQGARQPDFATLNKIADYFGVTIDYLIRNPQISELETCYLGEELISVNEYIFLNQVLKSFRSNR